MKSKVFLILIGLFLCSFETHKYYVSTSLFEYKEKMNTIQVTVRVFEDDFINALNTRYQKDLDLDSDLNEPENKQLISDYLLVNLGVVAENQKLKFNFLGSEEKNDTTALYIEFDIFNTKQRRDEIQKADIVVSMLPARFHIEVAKDCLNFGKNLVTASYVSHEMKALNKAVEAKGLLFLNEMETS